MYKALTTFADLQDNKYIYHEGDIYPRDGVFVSDARLKELSTNNNATGRALIVKADEPKATAKATPTEETKAEDAEVKTKPKKSTASKRRKKEVE